jgi:hypothetical protein
MLIYPADGVETTPDDERLSYLGHWCLGNACEIVIAPCINPVHFYAKIALFGVIDAVRSCHGASHGEGYEAEITSRLNITRERKKKDSSSGSTLPIPFLFTFPPISAISLLS